MSRITDPDASRVYLYCPPCGRIVGTYDPGKVGTAVPVPA